MDIHFLASVENSPENTIAIVHEICSIEDLNDCLKFDLDTVTAKKGKT